jgi:hypothetical protein
VLNFEIAEALGLVGGDGQQLTLNTRHGNIDSRLEVAALTILA